MSAQEAESNAMRLQQAHATTVEDVPDEDDVFPISASPPKPTIDTASTEMFPELGKPVAKPATAVSGAWGKANGRTNGSSVPVPISTNDSASESGAASPVGGPASGVKLPYVSLPGQQAEAVILGPGEMLDRRQMKRPLPDLIRDFNKKSRCKITHTPLGNKNKFEAAGPSQLTQDALRRFVDTIARKMDIKESIPASARALLIGRNGQTIKAIQEATGARIQVPRPDENENDDDLIDITVTGNTINVALACKMIRDKVGPRASKAAVPLKDIPAEFFHFIAGPNNSNAQALQSAHNVEIIVPEFQFVYPAASMPDEGEERPVFYSPQHGGFITVSGPRPGVQAAREAIEKRCSELREQLLLQQDQGLERNLLQFLFETNLSMSDFFAETECILIFPEDEGDAAIRIVGPSPDAIQMALNLCEERSADLHPGKVDMRTFGGDQGCWNVARYLRDVSEIARLEREHAVRFVTPKTLQGATSWDIYAKEHKRMTDARREASQIANAFPPSRMRNVAVNDFFYNHLRQYLAPDIRSKYSVRTVVPAPREKDADVLLVYEGPSGFESSFEVPRATSKPPTSEVQKFKKALEEAEAFIKEFVQRQGEIATIPIQVPAKYHEKLRKFVKSQQDSTRSKESATIRASQIGNTVKFSGPKKEVEALVVKVNDFIKQEEEYDKERGFTLDFEFPQKFANHLIGKGGQKIHQMREKYDVEIQVKDGKVELRGPKVKAEAARKDIQSLAKQLEDETSHIFKVDPKYHSSIIGSHGSKIHRLEEKYKVRIMFPNSKVEHSSDRDSDAGDTKGSAKPRHIQKADEVMVRGPKRGADEARDEILSFLSYLRETGHEAVVTVKQKQLPSLIGTGGRVLEDLRVTTGARIDIQNESRDKGSEDENVEIRIQGTKEAIQAAKKAILEKKAVFDDTIVCTIEVERKHHRALIGSGGNNIRDIVIKAGGPEERREQARTVRFPQQESEGNSIKVEGRKSVVEAIIAAIEAMVTDRESQVTESIDIPTDKHRGLIGRGGDKKRDLESQFSVSINIPHQGDGRTDVNITGQPANVAKAKTHIESLVKEQQGEIIQVPRKFHHAISNNGRFFRDARNNFNVSIDHLGQKVPSKPIASESQTNSPLITDEGDDEGAAYRWTATKTSTEEGDIPWNLRGTSENVAKVMELVQKELNKATTIDTRGTLDIEDTSTYRFVIGTGGRTIQSIREETGCDIQVPRGNSEKGISIIGSKDGVEKARDMILAAIKDGKSSRRD